MQPLEGLTVVTLEHAIAGAVRDAPARRPRRPRHQDRAARRRRLRPRLRRPRARPGLALRLDQPLQGEPHARRQAPRRPPRCCERLVLEKADVVVQNLAPGAAARLGLGYERLAAQKPAIIVCDISGYGADGPYRDKKAYDLLIQSEAGFVSVTGTAGRAVQGRAVDRRHRRRHVRLHQHPGRAAAARADRRAASTSTSRCWSRWPSGRATRSTTPSTARRRRRAPAPRTPPSTPTARSRPATAARVMLGLQNEREWVSFCEIVLQRPELAHRPALRRQRQPRGRARRAARSSSSTPSRALTAAAGAGAAGRGADRQRPGQHHARRVGAPAAEGARPLARGRHAGRAGARAAAAGQPGTTARGWTRCRRSASTPTPSWPSWATTPQAIARAARRRRRSEMAAPRDLPVRAGQPPGALRQGAGQRRRRGRARPRGRGRRRTPRPPRATRSRAWAATADRGRPGPRRGAHQRRRSHARSPTTCALLRRRRHRRA